MIFDKTTLSNGLRVITAPMSSMESATVQIAVDAGTRDEKKEANGLAHFLEHMVFKGTEKYPTAYAISTAVDGIGAEFNANTGKERTAYYIKAWERHLSLAFDILSGFVKYPLLNPEEIEREKGVIIEEIAMYEDMPRVKVPQVFEELLYDPSSLSWDIAGSRETVKAIKREDFVEFRSRLYRADNMVLSVAGKFNKDEVIKLADEHFGAMEGKNVRHDHIKEVVGSDKNPEDKSQVKLVNKKTEQAHLVLGVRGNPRGNPYRYTEAVLASVLGGGMSSRLFIEVRERRGLAYYVRSDVEHYSDHGYIATAAGVRIDAVEEAVKVILNEYVRICNEKVSWEELNKAKEYLKGRMALGLEDTHAVSDYYGDQELFDGEVKTADQIIEEISKVTAEEIQELAKKLFCKNKLNLALIGPYEDKLKFQQLLNF